MYLFLSSFIISQNLSKGSISFSIIWGCILYHFAAIYKFRLNLNFQGLLAFALMCLLILLLHFSSYYLLLEFWLNYFTIATAAAAVDVVLLPIFLSILLFLLFAFH